MEDCILPAFLYAIGYYRFYLNNDMISRIHMVANNRIKIIPTVNNPLKKPSTELLFRSVLSIILNIVHKITSRSSSQPATGTKSGMISTGLAIYKAISSKIRRLPIWRPDIGSVFMCLSFISSWFK